MDQRPRYSDLLSKNRAACDATEDQFHLYTQSLTALTPVIAKRKTTACPNRPTTSPTNDDPIIHGPSHS
ncbi:hypothetical protein BO99DRAFT_403854, partial [Aspergillus violaceofuscus CBS 115571]